MGLPVRLSRCQYFLGLNRIFTTLLQLDFLSSQVGISSLPPIMPTLGPQKLLASGNLAIIGCISATKESIMIGAG
jgi:hypothetical protein